MADKCAICLETFDEKTTEPGKMKYALPCNSNHEFHVECIMMNFRMGNATCPLCRDIPENCRQVDEATELEQMESIARLHWKKHNDTRNRYARKHEDVQKSMRDALKKVSSSYRDQKNKISKEMDTLYKLDRKFDEMVEAKRK